MRRILLISTMIAIMAVMLVAVASLAFAQFQPEDTGAEPECHWEQDTTGVGYVLLQKWCWTEDSGWYKVGAPLRKPA